MKKNRDGIFIDGGVTGNTNINTGNDVSQTNTIQNDISEKAFEELFKDIKNKCNEQQSEQMTFFAEQLKEAFANNDKSQSKKLLGFLQNGLGNIASLASIASIMGLSF